MKINTKKIENKKKLTGISLIEVLIAMLLLTLSTLTIFHGLINSQRTLADSQHATLRYQQQELLFS